MQGLSGGGAQGAVAVLIGQPIQGQIELWRHMPPRNAGAQHHLVGPLQSLLLSLLPQIPVVLLVDTVELEHLHRRFAEVGGVLVQLLLQGIPQKVAFSLDVLYFGALGFGGGRGGHLIPQ